MFAASWLRAKPSASAALVYALTGAVVASALYQLEEYYSHIAPPVLFFPLIFLVPYIRFLIRQASAKQRVLAVVLNALAAAVTAGYLRTIPIWPPRSEPPFPMILLGAVVVPASFVLAAIALFCRHRLAYAAGTLATLVAWPCVALIAAELQSFAVAYRLATLGCILSLLAFSIACFSVFLKPTVGYYAGLLAALLGWPFFVLREVNYPYHGNSWLWFNVPDYPRFSNEHTYVQLTVWAIVLLIFCTVTSFLRLSPASWVIKGTPVRDRTWPVFAASFVIVAAWFMRSATPYRVPMEASQLSADITVAHVEKYGFSFHETRVYLLRDGQFYISYDYRKPFQYRSQGTSFSGVVSQDAWDKARRLMSSPAFTALGNPRENVPPNWNSDTWYVRGERLPLVAFSTSNKTIPPQELVDWFHEMRNLPKTQGWHFVTKDICLSFCYEPSR